MLLRASWELSAPTTGEECSGGAPNPQLDSTGNCRNSWSLIKIGSLPRVWPSSFCSNLQVKFGQILEFIKSLETCLFKSSKFFYCSHSIMALEKDLTGQWSAEKSIEYQVLAITEKKLHCILRQHITVQSYRVPYSIPSQVRLKRGESLSYQQITQSHQR